MLPQDLQTSIRTQLTQAVAWLLAQQASDGAWHSSTYGTLKAGAGLTALAIYTLSKLPEQTPEIREAVHKAGNFLSAGFELKRTVAAPDGTLDYPTYAAALLISAGKMFPALTERLPREKLLQYLLAAQVTQQRGFPPDAPEYGGWDLLGRDDAHGITTGTNVSVMRFVLEALSAGDFPGVPEAKKLALVWLLKAQQTTGSGGFPFTVVADSLNNKAQWSDEQHRQPQAYGSATADGLRCLLACGLTIRDELVKQAVQWLAAHPVVEWVPGFEKMPEENSWAKGLRYYYAQALVGILPLLPPEMARTRSEQLAKILLAMQQPAGCWQNDSARMREDDPLIATNFALQALAQLL
jgi:hypothetical protein